MKGVFTPPFPKGLSYFVGEWGHQNPNEPVRFWYEIDEDGSCLREVEMGRDGKLKADAVANYPDGATDFGFGTLHGASFWGSEWNDEPDSSGETTNIVAISKQAFEDIWAAAS